MTTPVSNTPVNTGRSPQADLIYQQYLNYYNDINNKLNAINQLPAAQAHSPKVVQDRAQLISLQQQLYPLYIGQYTNSSATLASFQAACATIVSSATAAFNDAVAGSTVQTPQAPSPITVYTNGSSTPPTTPTTPPPTTTTPPTTTPTTPTTTTTTPVSTGRSPDAAKIYDQYVTYYNDINTKINALNQLPSGQVSPNVRSQLVSLQQQLYPIYTAQYNNSNATIASFQAACAAIQASVAQVYNSATQPVVVTPPPVVVTPPPVVVTPPPVVVTPPVVTTPPPTTTPVTPVAPVTPAISSGATRIENGTWYIDWTSWTTPIPDGVNTVNLFVGNMHLDSAGKPVVDGFGVFSQNYAQMDALIQACHAKGIAVKMSIGGGGGSYDNCWDALTASNVKGFAQALSSFCTTHGADGIDFDVEEFSSATDKPAQQALVGNLIKEFKAINPNYLTSLCTNAGFGPNFPWQGIVQNIMNASLTTDPVTNKTTCGVDRLYIMSYFNSLSDEQGWVTGWANWLKSTYNLGPSQVTVGLNVFANAYDVSAFAAWAAQKGYSTSFWDYDPGNPTQSSQNANTILNAYQKARAA